MEAFSPPLPQKECVVVGNIEDLRKRKRLSPAMAVGRTGTEQKQRILVVGATGFIGQFLADASIEAGKETFVLVRTISVCSSKRSGAIDSFRERGATVVQGMINDRAAMEKILKEYEIDVVISAVGGEKILDQLPLIEAIKAAGTVKRFLPSEFGHDVDRADPVEPGLEMYNAKRRVRRMAEQLCIPYTFICCNSIASWPYYDNTHPSEVLPPLDKFQIYGDGTVQAYFVAGSDIGKFTMKIINDDQTLNKSVHFRPKCNLYNMNQLASLWEKKIGKTLPRVIITEDDLLAAAAEMIIPESIVASFTHDIFIKGCQINYSCDGPNDLEATNLYPDEGFRTMDECFTELALKLNGMQPQSENEKTMAATASSVDEPYPITATCA